jgi:hypothetical protein
MNFRSFNILKTAFVSADSHGAVFAISLNRDSILALGISRRLRVSWRQNSLLLEIRIPALAKEIPVLPGNANSAEKAYLTGIYDLFFRRKIAP